MFEILEHLLYIASQRIVNEFVDKFTVIKIVLAIWREKFSSVKLKNNLDKLQTKACVSCQICIFFSGKNTMFNMRRAVAQW